MAVAWLMVVVNTKKVINKNPRSTIGVRSTLVDCFFAFLTPGPFLCPPPEVSTSAILVIFNLFSNNAEQKCTIYFFFDAAAASLANSDPAGGASEFVTTLNLNISFFLNDSFIFLKMGYLAWLSPLTNKFKLSILSPL